MDHIDQTRRVASRANRCEQNPNLVCLNGGTCVDNGSSCYCAPGFGGPFCQFPCDLECKNGGVCNFVSQDKQSFSAQLWGKDKDGLYCECPDGFAGLHCQYTAEVCGTGEHVCLHGSKCVPNPDKAGAYRCECQGAVSSDKVQYADEAGECQRHQTEFCTPVEGHVEYIGGMAVAAFCVNDGKCTDVEMGGKVYVFLCVMFEDYVSL
jgi:hypothetical protein